jgi:transcription-repair coupling factor (superfamily II helicase)
MNEKRVCDRLGRLDISDWRKNISLHLPVAGGARPWLCREFEHPILAVLPNSRSVRDFSSDADAMRSFAELPPVSILPETAIENNSDSTRILETQKAARGETLSGWREDGGILLSTPGALMSPVSLGGDKITLATGPGVSRSFLLEWLSAHGYEKTDIVWTPGQFAYHGGIVDLFDPSFAWPIRAEFFDDDIESMRYFASDTQRSVERFSRIEIRALTARHSAAIEDFFPQDAHVLFVEPGELENAADNYAWLKAETEGEERAETREWRDVERFLALFPRVRLTASVARTDAGSGITGLPNFRGRMRDLEAYCLNAESRKISVSVISEAEHFRKWGSGRGYKVSQGSVSEGFYDYSAKTLFIGDLELSGMTVSSPASQARVPLDWGDRLLPGQWAVHEDYGVARYLGSEQLNLPGGLEEYIVLEYAEERKLKIPVAHFHKISPYRAYPGAEPTADNLRGGQWKKMSSRAQEQAAAAARYLMDVYAKREVEPGRAFTGDDEQESEFEKTFPYKETSDQLRAISEVMRDLSRPVPMDRLLVGDVGFGKTEVALRAAARCVFEGAQVALIAPTTLLAEQHFVTWSARFDSFGIRVEVLSRFVSAARQKKILGDTASGRVDVLLGTHRILGRDVVFKNLGLLIVDEEHRFGVMHKERLKNLYPGVDVLSLSATPIPRSLHMSLSGLRDLSLIQTPPRQRMPVMTAAGIWSETLVKNAVLREYSRGGQTFYIHNRVNSIDREAMTVRRLFPKLRVDVAHGRMREKDLKDAMDRFAHKETDILVCTAIVESGLDIPGANTLIVSDSQDLGLAQMHQLRGRVGRRDEQAFALFLYPEGIVLTKEALERLEAIAAMGEFGAGYELARRDLEIRGGGELAGVAQHGHIGRVGFQRYCDLLEEAIRRAKGDFRERTQVEAGLPCAIPNSYIQQESLRVALYRKLLWAGDAEVLDVLRDETEDRFGPVPPALDFLFGMATLRIIGQEFGISHVSCGRDETSAQCEEWSPLFERPPLKGWFRREKGFAGPGGMESFRRFASFVASIKSEKKKDL